MHQPLQALLALNISLSFTTWLLCLGAPHTSEMQQQVGFSLYQAGLSDLVPVLHLHRDSPTTYFTEACTTLSSGCSVCLESLQSACLRIYLLVHGCSMESRVPQIAAGIAATQKNTAPLLPGVLQLIKLLVSMGTLPNLCRCSKSKK